MKALRETVAAGRGVGGAATDGGDSKRASAEVILIPKQLRMEWTDAIMLDPDLPPLAKVVAGVIGAHLNRHRGDTYLRQDTIADQLRLSLRAVQGAIGRLEAAGYLVIDRRELGQRASDGRRVCGGRGVANTYAPALDGTQVSATAGGKRLAERVERLMEERTHRHASIRAAKDAPPCVHSEPERTHGDAGKDAPGCVPTLTDPSDQNPTRARRRSGEAAAPRAALPGLGAFGQALERRIGTPLLRAWFREIEIGEVRLGKPPELVLLAPTRFIADYLRTQFAEAAIECWNLVCGPAQRVGRVVVEVKK